MGEVTSKKEIAYQIDQFIDGNPYIENWIERAVEQRVKQHIAQRIQRIVLEVIRGRFPALADQAQPQIEQIQNTDALETLFEHLLTATTERDLRLILQLQENQ